MGSCIFIPLQMISHAINQTSISLSLTLYKQKKKQKEKMLIIADHNSAYNVNKKNSNLETKEDSCPQ